MKRLHRMMIGQYLGPLLITFILVLFILLMQFVWKYVDDFMGKGLEWHVMTELLVFAAASFVPLALPLAILLSSIMTMGALGESSELVPLRSAGLHLFSILQPLIVVAVLLSAGSFFFSNNVMPVANLKFQSLLWDITRKKPALNLQPGQFYNGIEGFSIRVDDKNADTGELSDVLIYDHREKFAGNKTVIRAEKGEMQRTVDGSSLVLVLYNTRFYDERSPGKKKDNALPMVRGTSEMEVMRFDLSGLGMHRTDQDLFKDHYKMLTIGQLNKGIDSLELQMAQRLQAQRSYMHNALYLTRDSVQELKLDTTMRSMDGFLSSLPPQGRSNVLDVAMNMARNNINFLQRSIDEKSGREKAIARFKVEWHRKLMLAAACIIFFFIGAPLGAIIRKGGLGLPAVFAIVFFLVFHIISFSTEKLVISGKMEAFPGMWISSMILLPMGLYLTWKAATDSPILELDAYYRGWYRLKQKLGWKSHEDPATLP